MESITNIEKNELIPINILYSDILSRYNLDIYNVENIKFKDTEKQRAVYKVDTNKGTKCLKKVYYSIGNLLFIYSVIEWLNVKGICTPRFISAKNGFKYIEYKKMLFILTDWVEGRKFEYDNIDDILLAAENLAKIHKYSKGFYPIEGSTINIQAADYVKRYNRYFLQLLESSNSAFRYKDKFSKTFLENFDYNIERAKESFLILSNIQFDKEFGDDVSKNSICHLDYVNKNLIITPENKICVIDFDRCAIDYPVHDISSFLKRFLKRRSTNWDFEICKAFIESYEKVRPLSYYEHLCLLSFLMFPQKYWKISRDYYKNINNCNKEAFVTILKKTVEQDEKHMKFCINFKDYIYKKFGT